MALQPGRKIFRRIEIQKRFAESPKVIERQGCHLFLVSLRDRAQAPDQESHHQPDLTLMTLLPTLLPTLAKNLLIEPRLLQIAFR
jgi:hypothetical protein